MACLTAAVVTLGLLPLSVTASSDSIDLAASASNVKLLGRTTVGENGIEPHSTGAGIAFYSECSGDITLTMTGQPTKFDSLYLAVFIDGELHRVPFKTRVNQRATQELVIAENLAAGKHKIEIVRETEENYGSCVWEAITLNGKMTPVEDAPLLIEFVGDSITAGYASYPQTEETKGLSVEHPALEAGVKTYAYLTAQALGADFQSVCASGYGVVHGYNYDGVTMPMMYEYAGYYHDNSENGKWAFERKADVVVIHLGANDSDRGTTYDEMADGAKAFMETVRAHNPDAAIVWATGETYLKFEKQLAEAVEALGGAEQGYYFTVLPEGKSGGAGHPNLEEHAETADALTAFLQENVLIVEEPLEETLVTTTSASSQESDLPKAPNRKLWWALGAAGAAAVAALVFAIVWKPKKP